MAKSILSFKGIIATPFLLLLLAVIFNYFWSLNNIVPKKYLKGSETDIALKYSFIACLPMFLMILSIMFYRGATIYGDTLQKTPETLYLVVSKMILNNTLEQTLVFLCSLLSAAALKALTKERIVLVVCMHFIGRILFWAGYLIGAYLNQPLLRSFGMSLNLGNTIILIYLNFQALLNT
jgi:hypothetical protein